MAPNGRCLAYLRHSWGSWASEWPFDDHEQPFHEQTPVPMSGYQTVTSRPSRCEKCGRELSQPVGRGRPRKWCSELCRGLARRYPSRTLASGSSDPGLSDEGMMIPDDHGRQVSEEELIEAGEESWVTFEELLAELQAEQISE